MSHVFDCADLQQRQEGITATVSAVRSGRLVVIPTDTVYGIGADAFNARAVADLLAAKRRGKGMPVPVLVGTHQTIDGLAAHVSDVVRKLISALWPGGLTVVVRQAPSLHWDLGETHGTVAIRMPAHPVALDVLATTGPMAVSSANVSGRQPAATAAAAQEQLGDLVAVYLEGGGTSESTASTIVDFTGDSPRILRHGTISVAQLREIAGVSIDLME